MALMTGAALAASPGDGKPKGSPTAQVPTMPTMSTVPAVAASAPDAAAAGAAVADTPLTGAGQRIYERTRPRLLKVRSLLKTQDSQSSVGSGFLIDD